MTQAAPRATGGPHADSVRTLASAILRAGLWLGTAAAAPALLLSAALAGWAGLVGGAVGAAIGFASGLATIGLMRVAAAMPVQSMFGIVLGGYTVKVFLLLAIAYPLRDAAQLHPLALGLTVVAVVVAWAAAGVVAFRRTRIPTIIPAGD